MSQLKEAVGEWFAHADPKAGLKEWTKQLCRILSEHEDELKKYYKRKKKTGR